MNTINAIGLFGPVGTPELLLALFILLLLFGAPKLPKLFRSMGQSVNEFKVGMKEGSEGLTGPEGEGSEGIFCSKCGAKTSSDDIFCPKCGNKLKK